MTEQSPRHPVGIANCKAVARQLVAQKLSMRISAISYLNTAPLMWDFEHGLADPGFEVSYTIPSQCALELQNGTADIGIIPAAAYATIPRPLDHARSCNRLKAAGPLNSAGQFEDRCRDSHRRARQLFSYFGGPRTNFV